MLKIKELSKTPERRDQESDDVSTLRITTAVRLRRRLLLFEGRVTSAHLF